MTPAQKAKELMDKIEGILGHSLPMGGEPYYPETKQCALIAVDEIIGIGANEFLLSIWAKEYWIQVKQEIEKL